MGEVWEADQLHPVRRRVALKLIKPRMGSSENHRSLRVRAAGAGAHAAPLHRPDLRRRDHRRRAALLRHGARRWGSGHPLLRRAAARRAGPAPPVPADLRRGPARSPQGRDPSRPQAVERAGDGPGRRGDAEGDRLRPGQGHPGAAGRPHQDRARRVDGHPGVRQPGADAAHRRRRGHAQRRLLAGDAPLRAAGGSAAVRCQRVADGVRAEAADRRDGVPAAERPLFQPAGPGSDRGGARLGLRAAATAAGRRSRLDRAQGARAHPRRPVRIGRRAVGRHRTAPAPRAGGGRTAQRRLPRPQVRAPAPRRRGRGQRTPARHGGPSP